MKQLSGSITLLLQHEATHSDLHQVLELQSNPKQVPSIPRRIRQSFSNLSRSDTSTSPQSYISKLKQTLETPL
jgi:hypothetical protein